MVVPGFILLHRLCQLTLLLPVLVLLPVLHLGLDRREDVNSKPQLNILKLFPGFIEGLVISEFLIASHHLVQLGQKKLRICCHQPPPFLQRPQLNLLQTKKVGSEEEDTEA